MDCIPLLIEKACFWNLALLLKTETHSGETDTQLLSASQK